MTHFRFIPIAAIVASATLLVACTTAPPMPMGDASAWGMATPDQMARMDAQMRTMQAMHEKMMNAKTPTERSTLMAEHRKAMQDGMQMMAGMGDMKGGMQGMGQGMGGVGMGNMKDMPGDMKGMQGMPGAGMGDMKGMQGMAGNMSPHDQAMAKRMEMMQLMMKMMDQIPAELGR